MNNKIKELAKQALDDVCVSRTVKGQIERTWNPDAYDQRFAELIIENCAKIVGDSKVSAEILDYFYK
jgi:hypothetical protein